MVLWNSVNWTPHVDHGATSANRIIGNSCSVPCPAFTWLCLCHPLVYYLTPPPASPSYAVIVEGLAPAERPERCSSSQAESVSLHRLQHHTGNRLEFILDFLVHIFKNEHFIVAFMRLCMCPLVSCGNHLRDLHGSLRQRLPVVPAG